MIVRAVAGTHRAMHKLGWALVLGAGTLAMGGFRCKPDRDRTGDACVLGEGSNVCDCCYTHETDGPICVEDEKCRQPGEGEMCVVHGTGNETCLPPLRCVTTGGREDGVCEPAPMGGSGGSWGMDSGGSAGMAEGTSGDEPTCICNDAADCEAHVARHCSYDCTIVPACPPA